MYIWEVPGTQVDLSHNSQLNFGLEVIGSHKSQEVSEVTESQVVVKSSQVTATLAPSIVEAIPGAT